MDRYHDIISKFVHEVRRLGSLVVVKPHGSLELVTGVQQQDVLLLLAKLRHFREPPGDPGEARAVPGTLSRVHAGLLESRMVVVGVEQSQLERGRRGRVRKVEESRQQSAKTRPGAHRRAARQNTQRRP